MIEQVYAVALWVVFHSTTYHRSESIRGAWGPRSRRESFRSSLDCSQSRQCKLFLKSFVEEHGYTGYNYVPFLFRLRLVCFYLKSNPCPAGHWLRVARARPPPLWDSFVRVPLRLVLVLVCNLKYELVLVRVLQCKISDSFRRNRMEIQKELYLSTVHTPLVYHIYVWRCNTGLILKKKILLYICSRQHQTEK